MAQLPLSWIFERLTGCDYVMATATALLLLVVLRFAACQRWLYCPAPEHGSVQP
jgi:hypothetical protein